MGDSQIPEEESLDVSIDRGQSFGDLVTVGQYTWVNDRITEERFPVAGSAERRDFRLRLVHLGRVAATSEVEEKIGEMGLEVAEMEHLLVLRAVRTKHWPKHLRLNVAALGSGWESAPGLRLVPCLIQSHGLCFLQLNWGMPRHKWEECWRFLAITKK